MNTSHLGSSAPEGFLGFGGFVVDKQFRRTTFPREENVVLGLVRKFHADDTSLDSDLVFGLERQDVFFVEPAHAVVDDDLVVEEFTQFVLRTRLHVAGDCPQPDRDEHHEDAFTYCFHFVSPCRGSHMI